MRQYQSDMFETQAGKDPFQVGVGFACASCGTRTNEEFLCECGTQHNGDGTIQEAGEINELGLEIPLNNDSHILTQETAKLCNSITQGEIEIGLLGEVEYIIGGDIKKSQISVVRVEKLSKSKSRIELSSSSNTFRCVVDTNNNSIGNFQEMRGTKKSNFTKKTWKSYKPSNILLQFLKENLF